MTLSKVILQCSSIHARIYILIERLHTDFWIYLLVNQPQNDAVFYLKKNMHVNTIDIYKYYKIDYILLTSVTDQVQQRLHE